MKIHLYNAGIFLALLITEICIGLYADPSGFIRCNMGDVLVIPTIYFFIRIFADPFPKLLPAAVFLLGCIAELLQLMDICTILNIPKGSLTAVLLGTNADLKDIFCYFAGMVLIYIYLFLKGEYKNVRD